MQALAKMPPEDVTRRFDLGDQYLRDTGVFFRQYGEKDVTDRAWPLSHVPVMIHESEWTSISQGLIQRAELLESVCADLYGEARLVKEGHLPASLIAMNPEWLRPMVGVRPRSGHFLNFIAFEIGRGPDGRWWVLGDRVQAPSGAGFALENRVATARVFADIYADSNVHRLAGFFRAFRDALNDLRGDSESRVGILTPGRFNDTYFEHAYIARYLGFMLLEGEDLTVQNGQVMVRTIAGLSPVSVLWRRIDASYADPLELNESSRLGTPGQQLRTLAARVGDQRVFGQCELDLAALLDDSRIFFFRRRRCRSLRGRCGGGCLRGRLSRRLSGRSSLFLLCAAGQDERQRQGGDGQQGFLHRITPGHVIRDRRSH